MFKYFFDVCIGGSADDMHDAMMSPAGIVGITLESLFLVGFSFLACHFDGEKKESYKKKIAAAWPYFRDVMKGVKNAYKGWRSVVVALSLMGVAGMSVLTIPVGVALGVLAALNRYFMRSITEARKSMMVNNTELLINLKKFTSLTAEEAAVYLKNNPIQAQTNKDRYLGFASSAVGGFVDGLYLYVGVLSLSALAPPLMFAMVSLCAFYTLACIITRLYEEYDFQLRLQITQTKCHLVIYTKQLQTTYAQLKLLEKKEHKSSEDLLEIKSLKTELCSLIGQFDEKRRLLAHQTSRTYFSACLLGLKNGLYAYGALSSVLFLISAFLVMGGVSFPPLAIAIIVSLGLVFIASFVIHSVVANYKHNKEKEKAECEEHYPELLEMKQHLEQHPEETPSLTTDELNQLFKEGLSVKPAPQYFFQEWFEVFRSFFSGLGKGQKFVDFAGNPLQEAGADGHYQDSPVMYVLGALSALLFGAILALRALARGLGRPFLGQANDLPSAVIEHPVKNETAIDQKTDPLTKNHEPIKTKVQGESIQGDKRTDSLKSSSSHASLHGFFKEKPTSLRRSKSENALSSLDTQHRNTIVGLG